MLHVTDAQLDSTADESPGVPDTSQQPAVQVVDLDAIERDLHDVEMALNRLADGTYWTDEITGEPIPEDVLVGDPTARRT